MCGIVGLFNPQNINIDKLSLASADMNVLAEGMLSLIRHRGPDEMGLLKFGNSFFANARLKIIDLLTGTQPISSCSKRFWIVYNGEIYDHSLIKKNLEGEGMQFETSSDTEVIVNLFEKYGTSLTDHLNGEYAFAIYDTLEKITYLFRDPLGIKPLYYSILPSGAILFSSEIKPILWATKNISPTIDPQAVSQSLETWTTIAPQTSFQNISQVKPGSFLKISNSQFEENRFWNFTKSDNSLSPQSDNVQTLLNAAIKRRMVADVPVGVYLSGGLDSTIVSLMAAQYSNDPIQSFSIEFENAQFDESDSQAIVQKLIGSEHHRVRISQDDLIENFIPSVIAGESILFRSAATPMFLLSRLVQQTGVKVVLTGEGSDELFGGYDIYKEAQILLRWAQDPSGNHFTDILKIYSYLPQFQDARASLMLPFYKSFLSVMSSNYSGHQTRWSQITGHQQLLDISNRNSSSQYLDRQYPEIKSLDTLNQTRAVECLTLLHGYLLSTQGDRMASAHSIETRLPFLDKSLLNYAFSHSVTQFMDGLNEKQILYNAYKKDLPEFLFAKRKKPFLSLDCEIFFTKKWPIQDYINSESLNQSGLFNKKNVLNFMNKLQDQVKKNKVISRRDNTAFFVILSTMVLIKEIRNSLQVNCIRSLIKKVVQL